MDIYVDRHGMRMYQGRDRVVETRKARAYQDIEYRCESSSTSDSRVSGGDISLLTRSFITTPVSKCDLYGALRTRGDHHSRGVEPGFEVIARA